MNTSHTPLILASGSPRRVELLQKITDHFEVIPSSVDEVIDENLDPVENVKSLALQKARWVADNHVAHTVIGADTIVVFEGDIIGKPRNAEDAKEILERLSGQVHQVMTGLAVISPEGKVYQDCEISQVRMKSLQADQVDEYIQSGEPMDKAGAYAIQGVGSALVESHEGSFSNIVGLPVETLRSLLVRSGMQFF